MSKTSPPRGAIARQLAHFTAHHGKQPITTKIERDLLDILLRCVKAERMDLNGMPLAASKNIELPAGKSLRLVDGANGCGIQRGAQAEHIACAYLLGEGYDVFKNVSPQGSADLIACKDDDVLRVDVKSGKTAMRTSTQIDEGVVLLYVDDNGRCSFDRPKSYLTEEQQNETDHPSAQSAL